MVKKIVFFGMLFLFLLAGAAGLCEGPDESYVSYDVFLARYSENLDMINQNEGRHLISLIFASGDNEGSQRVYTLSGDLLSAKMYTQKSEKRIVSFFLRLVCPNDLESSSVSQQDFTTSGYQSYAMLMAMANGDTAEERFQIVEQLNNGLRGKDYYGFEYSPYTIMARRKGNAVEFTFSSSYHEDEEAYQEALEDEQDALPLQDELDEEDEEDSLAG